MTVKTQRLQIIQFVVQWVLVAVMDTQFLFPTANLAATLDIFSSAFPGRLNRRGYGVSVLMEHRAG